MRRKILVAGLAVCMLFAACTKEKEVIDVPELIEPAMSISNTVKVERGDISNRKLYKADVVPYTEEYSFDIPGSVETVFVREGDRVKKGDKLAVLIGGIENTEKINVENEISSFKKNCAVENLEAEYDIKIMKLEREMLNDELKQLKGKEKKEKKKEYDLKTADINIAVQNLSHAKEIQSIELKELERKRNSLNSETGSYYLYSGMDGIVSCVAVSSNDTVEKGRFAVAVSDMNKKHVRSEYVYESDHKSAEKMYISYCGKNYDVEIRPYDMAKIKEQISSKMKVYSYFDIKNADNSLKIGECVDLTLDFKTSSDTLFLPLNAVYTENEQSYVYLCKDGRKIKTVIKKGIANSTSVEIIEGLEEGDDVYVKP